MLKLGSSKSWEEALEQLTGTREMNSSALVEYFDELLVYLKDQNRKNGDVIGWPEDSWIPPTSENNSVMSSRA